MPRDHEAKSAIIWEDKTPSEDKYLCLLYVIYLFPQKFCVCSKDVFCIAICPEGCKCAKHKQRTPNKPVLKNQINTELWFLIPATFPFLCLSTQVSSVISSSTKYFISNIAKCLLQFFSFVRFFSWDVFCLDGPFFMQQLRTVFSLDILTLLKSKFKIFSSQTDTLKFHFKKKTIKNLKTSTF